MSRASSFIFRSLGNIHVHRSVFDELPNILLPAFPRHPNILDQKPLVLAVRVHNIIPRVRRQYQASMLADDLHSVPQVQLVALRDGA